MQGVSIRNLSSRYSIGETATVYARVNGVSSTRVDFEWRIRGTSVRKSGGDSFTFIAEKEYDGKMLEVTARCNGITKVSSQRLTIEDASVPFYQTSLFYIIVAAALVLFILIILIVRGVKRRRNKDDDYYY